MALSDAFRARLGLEQKERFERVCQQKNTTPSAVIRNLVHDYCEKESEQNERLNPSEEIRTEQRWHTISSRVTTAELIIIKEKLIDERQSLSAWLLSLVQGAIRTGPQLRKAELLAVEHAVLQLRSIGRNLNQMVRAINEGKADRGAFSEKYARGLTRHITDLTRDMNALIAKASDRDSDNE